jgi:transposase
MIGLLPTTRIYLATAATDLRKAYDGLAALVRQSLGQDPLNGSLYVFCNRRRDRIKILFWEEGGYWLCSRRLEEGTFRWPKQEGACARYRREELLLLLGGIDLKQTQKRPWYGRKKDEEQK